MSNTGTDTSVVQSITIDTIRQLYNDIKIFRSCADCGKVAPVSEFPVVTQRGKRRRSSVCGECRRVRGRDRYHRHKLAVAGWRRKRRQDHQRKVWDYLVAHPCVDCGEIDPVVLDLDHVRGEKVLPISEMMGGSTSWSTIAAEIDKCEVRCANCHRRKTSERRRERL